MSKHRTGMVVELDKGAAVVLTPTGEFVKVKLTKGERWPELGEEITFPEVSRFLQFARMFRFAAVAALIGFLFIAPFVDNFALIIQPAELPVASYLAVDINPSIELGLGINQQVVSVKALNHDGKKVLSKLKLIGLPGENAVERIIEQSVVLGYLEPNTNVQNILITYVPLTEDRQSEQQLEKQLVAKAKKVLETRSISAEVEAISANGQVRSKARALGLSAGKYLVFLEAVNEGLKISEKQIKRESLARSINLAGGDLKQLIQKAAQEKDIAKLEEKVKAKLQLERKKYEDKKQKRKPERIQSHDKIKMENRIEGWPHGKGLKFEIGKFKSNKWGDAEEKRNTGSFWQQRFKELREDSKKEQKFPGNIRPQLGPEVFRNQAKGVTAPPGQTKKGAEARKGKEELSHEVRTKEAKKTQDNVKGKRGK